MNEMPKVALESADISRILTLLPHRYPFLMVDRIVDIQGDESCVGIKNVTANEPHFQGHFPEQPVMPGVLMIEGMAQTAGAMCCAHSMNGNQPRIVYFMTIERAKFRKPVLPGDTIEYRMRKLKSRANMWWFEGKAYVRDILVAEAEVSAMLVGR